MSSYATEMTPSVHPTLTLPCIQDLKAILASDLDDLLPGNPHLLPAARPTYAGRVVEDILNHHLLKAESALVGILRHHTVNAEIIHRGVRTCRAAVADQEARAINRLTRQFIERFCDSSGAIDWVKLVEFNSGNYDLDQFLPSA